MVSLVDVGKCYVKYEDVPTLLSGVMRRQWRNRRSSFWALRHVDLSVAEGEAVGVIGRNGAGKSTMLAMLAGVTAPTEGVVSVRGRVAPLLRLGVGFHEELTGRENVYINGTILGLAESTIDRVFDEIVAFAELEEFIDTPVKFYSSGMQARLGFGVAIASRPDVLIVDEVLAVGDMAFQTRSFDRMLEMQKQGTTILVVSHNLESIRRVCSRILVLDQGTPYYEGPVDEAIGRYHGVMRAAWEGDFTASDDSGIQANTDAPLEIVDVELLDENDAAKRNFESGSYMTVRIRVRFRQAVSDPYAGLRVTSQSNLLVYLNQGLEQKNGLFEPGSEAIFDVRLRLHLVTGTFTVWSWISWGKKREDHLRGPALPFYVSAQSKRGVANLTATHTVTRGESSPSILSPTDNREAASDPQAP